MGNGRSVNTKLSLGCKPYLLFFSEVAPRVWKRKEKEGAGWRKNWAQERGQPCPRLHLSENSENASTPLSAVLRSLGSLLAVTDFRGRCLVSRRFGSRSQREYPKTQNPETFAGSSDFSSLEFTVFLITTTTLAASAKSNTRCHARGSGTTMVCA